MVNRVQTIRYYTTLQRPPAGEFSGELYINYADIQIGALNQAKQPVDFVAVRYYSQVALYVAGDYAVYNGLLYRCIQNTPNPAGSFDGTRWSELLDLQEVQVLIQVETARAEAAEAQLQAEINAETAARIAGDNNLQNEINNLTTSISNIFPPGVSLDYYGATAPTGWLIEDGTIYNISTYPALGAMLGSKYGGNGTTTFAVPPSVGRFGVAAGGGYPLGSMGGTASATLSTTNLPSHTHTIQPHNHTINDPTHTHAGATIQVTGPPYLALTANLSDYPPVPGNLPSAATGITINTTALTTDPAGGSGGIAQPINTLPPYISRTRIIKT